MSGVSAAIGAAFAPIGFHPLIVGAECPAEEVEAEDIERNLCFHPLIVGAECPAKL